MNSRISECSLAAFTEEIRWNEWDLGNSSAVYYEKVDYWDGVKCFVLS
jgi:hypothetical protein